MSVPSEDNGGETQIQKRDKLIPWYFVMAFMVVFVVNGIFVYLAVNTNNGVVTENAYEKGMDYTRIVTEVRKQRALEQK